MDVIQKNYGIVTGLSKEIKQNMMKYMKKLKVKDEYFEAVTDNISACEKLLPNCTTKKVALQELMMYMTEGGEYAHTNKFVY